MYAILLCMLLSLSLPLMAAEKTPKMLIAEYESARLRKKPQALQNIFRLDPSEFSTGEFNAITDIIFNLYQARSSLLQEMPDAWRSAIADRRPDLYDVAPYTFSPPATAQLIRDYYHAKPTEKARALQDILRLDPSEFYGRELHGVLNIIIDLHAQKSPLLQSVPKAWQAAIVQARPALRKAFPDLAAAEEKKHAAASSSAAADEKTSAASSGTAVTTQPTTGPSAALRVVRSDAVNSHVRSLFFRSSYSEEIREDGYAQLRKYFDAEPRAMNLIPDFVEDDTLLMHFLSGFFVGAKLPPENSLPLIRYMLSHNANVIHKNNDGRNALEIVIMFYESIPEAAREEVITKIVDLMRKQGVSPIELEHQLSAMEKKYKDAIDRNSKLLSTPEYLHKEIAKTEISRNQTKLKLLEVAHAPLEVAAAQGTLEEVGMPREIRNIVGEYRVGDKKVKTEDEQKAFQIDPQVVDAYKQLRLTPSAHVITIKKKFRELSYDFQPGRAPAGHENEYAERLKAISNAYEILKRVRNIK